MLFNAVILKGRSEARINNRPEFDRFIASLAHSEKDVRLTFEVKKAKSQRSLMQNAYYHGGIVRPIMNRLRDLGHDVDHEATHEMLKGRFLYTELIDENSGEVIKVPRSTKNLTKMEFADYIAEIQQFAAEVLDIVLADPGEQLTIDTK